MVFRAELYSSARSGEPDCISCSRNASAARRRAYFVLDFLVLGGFVVVAYFASSASKKSAPAPAPRFSAFLRIANISSCITGRSHWGHLRQWLISAAGL